MAALSILYLGPQSGTCLDRANALRRLGHSVAHLDLRLLLPSTQWVDTITWKLGGHLFSTLLASSLTAALAKQRFDLCFVDGGELVTPHIIELLRRHAPRVINYNIDDPLGPRDGARFAAYRRSVAHYDLLVVVREDNVVEAKQRGARKVLRVYRSADEITHAPRQLTRSDHEKWDCEVLFLGTWFTGRGSFMLELVRLGVPLTLRGSSWQKCPEWPLLQPYWKGDELRGDDYAKALQCAKICLGLLSKENRDLHTTRSAEIPALGGLFCAERTSEHISMYAEGTEALFWDDAQECASVCNKALADDKRRNGIAVAGHQRVKMNGHYNEMVLSTILEAVGMGK
jgi:hypothetical protein